MSLGFSTMIAIHSISRLPSKIIGLKSPIEVMEKFFPLVRLRSGPAPQVFECVSYIHKCNMTQSKLFSKALKGEFGGYSNTQKGYRC